MELIGKWRCSNVTINGPAGDPEGLGNLLHRIRLLVVHRPCLPRLRRRHLRTTPSLSATGACGGQAIFSPFEDEVVLELGDRGEHVEEQPPTRGGRVDPLRECFQADEISAAIADKDPDSFVFSGRFGEPLITPTVRDNSWFDKALAAADLPPMTIHDLRHTAASLAISSGANVKAVQKMLGHASAAMTLDVYADLFEDDLDAVAMRLNDVVRASVVSKMWPQTLSGKNHLADSRQKIPELQGSSEGGTRTRDTTIMSRVL